MPEVRSHIARIVQSEKAYVETGWPLCAALPLLAELLGYRLHVVHLTRRPVTSALAHLAAGAYAGSEREDDYTRLATLGPRDRGVFQPHYEGTWHHLSPYEKCLFWWTEVNLFGLELPGRLRPTCFIRVKAEKLLAGERRELERLLGFIRLPWDERWLAREDANEVGWQCSVPEHVDPLEVHRHPTTIEVAAKLGYDVAALTRGELDAGAVSS